MRARDGLTKELDAGGCTINAFDAIRARGSCALLIGAKDRIASDRGFSSSSRKSRAKKKSNEHIGLQQYISCYDSKERKRSEEKANESKVRECIDDSKEQEEESAPMHQGITTKRDV